MRNVLGALALLTGLAGVARGQEVAAADSTARTPPMPRISVNTYVGLYAPVLPLVAIDNGKDASVALESAPAARIELSYHFSEALGLYAGMTHARSRVNHSTAMVLEGPVRDESPVGLFIPTLGIVWTPRGNWRVGPVLRLGGGVKFYDFALTEVKHGVQDLAGELGLGLVGGWDPIHFVAEARWMPSQFDPAYLPVSVIEGKKQPQNDWVFQVGIRFGL